MPRLTADALEDRTAPAVLIPDDPSYPDQYALGRVGAPAAWETFTGTGRTVVAVLDSGVAVTHQDLAANVWTNPREVPGNGIDDDRDGYTDDVHGWDFVGNDPDPSDADGHGTHLAGIIGAVGNNGIGVAAANWHATILPVRFLDANGKGTTADAVRGIDYAVAHGARVVNASWTLDPSPELEAAVGRARAAGVVIVAAAGNHGADLTASPEYPAAYAARYDNVVAVASTDAADRLAGSSNFGAAVTLAAPGVGVVSTLPGGSYGVRSGTSMAAGFVSGAVALLWDAHPRWGYRQVLDKLAAAVDPVPGLVGKVATGGRLNIDRMLDAPPDPPGLAALPADFAVGSDRGPAPAATLRRADGLVRVSVSPGAGFAGGVRVTAADLTGDGVAELVIGSGPGGPSEVRGYDGATGAELFALRPFEPGFFGGVYVAAGDLTGDGTPELVVSADEGGGPRVIVFNGRTRAIVADFMGLDDPGFRGGVRVAVGDLDGDGTGDLLVSAGFGGGPRVAGYDGRALIGGTRTKLFNDFFLFEPALRNGAYLAVGDVNGDGFADLIGGGGPGGSPRVLVKSGADLAAGVSDGAAVLANFFAGDPNTRGGVRVAARALDADGRADIVTGVGAGAGSRVTAYLGSALAPSGTPTAAVSFDAVPGSADGVFVG